MKTNLQESVSLAHWSAREVIQGTLFILAVVLAFWLIYYLRSVIVVLLLAVALGIAIRPFVDWLYHRKVPRAVGVILIYSLLLIAMITAGLFIMPVIADQVTHISKIIPEYYSNFRSWVINTKNPFIQRLGFQLPFQLSFGISTLEPSEGESLDRVAALFKMVSPVFRGILATGAVLLLAFYWTLESERTIRGILLLIPVTKRDHIRKIIQQIERNVGGFIRGQAILSLLIGVASLIIYLLIGLPYALALGIFAGFMEAIPVVGPVLGIIPAVFVAASFGPEKLVLVIITGLIIQGVENYFLVPRVMNRSAGVNPIVTLLALVSFTTLLGFPGALLAIPAAAVIQLLLDRLVFKPQTNNNAYLGGRDIQSLIRYELSTLAKDVRKQIRQKDPPADINNDLVENEIETIVLELDQYLDKNRQEIKNS